MKSEWRIGEDDVARLRSFMDVHRNSRFVQNHLRSNVTSEPSSVTRDDFWRVLVSALVTTQQRSGPGQPVQIFIAAKPFPLAYQDCVAASDVVAFAHGVLKTYRLRRSNKIPPMLGTALGHIDADGWPEIERRLEQLRLPHDATAERTCAEFLAATFDGVGPKQSRNILQMLRLTRYEVPLDSRITKWLREFGFPVPLSPAALADAAYYSFVSDGFQQLCAAAGVYPCVACQAI